MIFILTYWRAILIALLVAAFVGTVLYKNARIAALDQELATAEQTAVTLRSALTEQNAAVDGFKRAADAQLQAHQAQLHEAQIAANKAKKRASDLLAAQRPANTTACEAAEQLFNEILK